MYGTGTMYYANGDKYEGGWKDDCENGYGTMYYANGDKYEGNWADGFRVGYGTYYHSNGKTEQGRWHADELCEVIFKSEWSCCTIRKVKRTNNFTTIFLAYNNVDNDEQTLNISHDAYIEVSQNERFKLINSRNIAIEPNTTKVKANSIKEFILIFPSLPNFVKKFNLIFDPTYEGLNFYDVEL